MGHRIVDAIIEEGQLNMSARTCRQDASKYI
jgi:hypothetical protein